MSLGGKPRFSCEGFYRNLFEGVPCMVAVIDREYRIISSNKAFKDKMAVTPGQKCHQVFWGKDRVCGICSVEKTLADGGFHTTEERGIYKDGSKGHWIVSTAPVTDEDGEIVAAIKMCQDITERKQLEEDLLRSEQKYHAIFSNIPFAVFLLDPETLVIKDVNAKAKQTYGFAKGELLGLPFTSLCSVEDAGDVTSALRCMNSLEQVGQLDKTGRRFWAQLVVSGYEYPGHKVLLVTAIDITHRLETEQQLIQASKMATLGEMATGMAHEINQPLTVIQTSVDFILRKVRGDKPVEPATLAQLSELMGQHVARAADIITHMREFGRKHDQRTTPVDVNAVLERAYEIFRQQLALRDIEVVWDLDELEPIQADANRLEQVFINLLINARDAIEARAKTERFEKRISITTRAEGFTVLLRVEDTGAGVPSHLKAKIFEPFFTTKEVGKGTGLGLSITYGIVKDFGGDITLADTTGPGAAFEIRFPAVTN